MYKCACPVETCINVSSRNVLTSGIACPPDVLYKRPDHRWGQSPVRLTIPTARQKSPGTSSAMTWENTGQAQNMLSNGRRPAKGAADFSNFESDQMEQAKKAPPSWLR